MWHEILVVYFVIGVIFYIGYPAVTDWEDFVENVKNEKWYFVPMSFTIVVLLWPIFVWQIIWAKIQLRRGKY